MFNLPNVFLYFCRALDPRQPRVPVKMSPELTPGPSFYCLEEKCHRVESPIVTGRLLSMSRYLNQARAHCVLSIIETESFLF